MHVYAQLVTSRIEYVCNSFAFNVLKMKMSIYLDTEIYLDLELFFVQSPICF